MASIVADSGDAIIGNDLLGLITVWNGAAEQMFGYSAGEMIGTHIARLMHGGAIDAGAPTAAEFRSGERREAFQAEWRAKDGRVMPVSVRVSPIKGSDGAVAGMSLIVREVTATDHRTGPPDLNTALINSLPGLFSLFNVLSGQIICWNENFSRVTGYSDDEISKMSPEDFVAPEERDRLRARIADTMTRGKATLEVDIVLKDGGTCPYYFTGTKAEVGGLPCIIAMGIDISDRKLAEHARLMAEAASREARRELARMARISRLGEFVASVAHEINQPLAAVATNAGAALRWIAAAPARLDEAVAAINRISSDAARAGAVIRRIREDGRRSPARHVEVDLNLTLHDALDFVQDDLARRNVLLRTEFADNLPMVMGDPVQLQQVMLNLIVNGLEAMTPNADSPRILRVATGVSAGGDAVFEIEDNGTGLDPATRDRIFDHFFTTKTGGTGLGLAISRTIVEAHGGSLQAMDASSASRGALFRVTLPRASDRQS